MGNRRGFDRRNKKKNTGECSPLTKQEPVNLPDEMESEGNARIQYGALCYRIMRGKPQVLLVTSRTRRRWIIPKGWPIKGKSAAEAACIEAWEEGGVQGKPVETCVGQFGYIKLGHGEGPDQPCVVSVYPVKVKSLAKEYRERKQRRRKWFSLKQASKKVAEPELRQLLKAFDPGKL